MKEKGIEMDFLKGGQPDICQHRETVSERVVLLKVPQEYKHLFVNENEVITDLPLCYYKFGFRL